MNPYINDRLSVIDGMNNNNTYKLAWGRALVEICYGLEKVDEPTVITFDTISEVFLKYYWNQTYLFKLYQVPAHKTDRTFIFNLIYHYFKKCDSYISLCILNNTYN